MDSLKDLNLLSFLNVEEDVDAKEAVDRAKRCVRTLGGLRVQPVPNDALALPYWGLFDEVYEALPGRYISRISDVLSLHDNGDIPRPEKTVIRLDPTDHFKVHGRWVRAIKLKGISSQIRRVKQGERRHIRLLGYGDTPTLVPYLNPRGESQPIPFEVGEPWGAKRIRSVVNEVLMTGLAFRQGCAVMVPIGMGMYEDPELLFKGEPLGFSIWGLEHPDDTRFIHIWNQRISDDRQRALKEPGNQDAIVSASFEWTRERLMGVMQEARRYHDVGLVHHELQFDNHAYHNGSLTVVDWEEAAHESQLTRAQFLESVLIDLYKLSAFCGVLENPYIKQIESRPETDPPSQQESEKNRVNWFVFYFGDTTPEARAALEELLPVRIRDRSKRGAFRKTILPLIERLYGDKTFGAGVDWQASVRPYQSGFSSDAPRWQPGASTTIDAKLFVRSGSRAPGVEEATHPTSEIEEAERAICEGRFEDAVDGYALLSNDPAHVQHSSYVRHNLASLCLALRRDDDAAQHYKAAYLGP